MLLLGAACAEFVGATALCPWEMARIRIVTEPSFAPGAPDIPPVYHIMPPYFAGSTPYTPQIYSLASRELRRCR